MNAKDFNEQIDSVLTPILAQAGFKRVKTDFVRETEFSQLVLLRRGGSKFANICQFTRFMVCFRHRFLRDVWEQIPVTHPKEGSGYPFRIRPNDLQTGAWRRWNYCFDLNASEHDEIQYGDLDDAEQVLAPMGEAVSSFGISWASKFTLRESLHLLSTSSAGAFVEKLWIEDYKKMLQQIKD